MLAMKFSRSKRIGATALHFKGVTEYGVKASARFIQSTGVRSFVNFSDGEPALKALKDIAARTVQGVEHVSKEVPVGDHAENGEIECCVRELKRQMRAMRLALENNLGTTLDAKDPVLAWMPAFAADVISRYRRGSDGKTGWQRESGRQWAKRALQFGEKIMIREAKERIGVVKRDWEPRLIPVRYMGHHARTGSIVGLTKEGVKWGESPRRLPLDDWWSPEGWNELRGLPWDATARSTIRLPR